MIEAVNIAKYYGAHAAVAKLSLSIAAGEVVGLLGLNGAGKTTTLRILSGLTRPSSGDVLIGGISMAAQPELARAAVGFLPETPPLYQDMRVRAYLQFVGRLRRLGDALEANIDGALAATDLLAVQGARIATLSHGYHRRLGIAQTLVGKPRVVLLDEPTSGLDPMQVVHMRTLIRGLRGRATIVLSSHVLPEIGALCDRVIVMDEGRVIAQGSLAQLADDPSGHRRLDLEVVGDPMVLRSTLEARPEVVEVGEPENIAQEGTASSGPGGPRDILRLSVTMRGDGREALCAALVHAGFGVRTLAWQPVLLEHTFLRLMDAGQAQHLAQLFESPTHVAQDLVS